VASTIRDTIQKRYEMNLFCWPSLLKKKRKTFD
jgi:hypothetical protein